MPISPTAAAIARPTSFSALEGAPTPSRPINRNEAIDTFVRSSSDPFTHTPITDAFVATIQSPATPASEKLALALLTPIMVPITVALDVVLWPLIKIQQVGNWIKSKFA